MLDAEEAAALLGDPTWNALVAAAEDGSGEPARIAATVIFRLPADQRRTVLNILQEVASSWHWPEGSRSKEYALLAASQDAEDEQFRTAMRSRTRERVRASLSPYLVPAGGMLVHHSVKADGEWHEVACWGDPLSVICRDREFLEFWSVVHDPDDEGERLPTRMFRVIGTSRKLENAVVYWGTGPTPDGQLVWHLVEQL